MKPVLRLIAQHIRVDVEPRSSALGRNGEAGGEALVLIVSAGIEPLDEVHYGCPIDRVVFDRP